MDSAQDSGSCGWRFESSRARLIEKGQDLENGHPGDRGGLCGVASELADRAAERNGLVARMYQNYKVYDALVMDSRKFTAFGHVFCVVEDGEKQYLVDLTYVQNINPSTKTIDASLITATGKEMSDPHIFPIISQLIKHGYFLLNDNTLLDYLYINSCISREDLELNSSSVTTERLKLAPQYEHDIEVESLDRLLDRIRSF